jgi:hypothetical protein
MRRSCALLLSLVACRSGEAAESTGTSEAASEASGFVVAPDLAAAECDPGGQDCGDGRKCTPFASDGGCCVDTTRCVPVTGTRTAGEICVRAEGTDDCAAGLFCLTAQSGGAGQGVCVALCDAGDPAAACGADHCVQFNDGVLPLCRAACDPLAQGCPEGQACYASLTEQVFVCLNSSHAPGRGLAGEACATISACQAGLLCAPAAELEGCGDELCCTELCPIGGECPAPHVCAQVYDPGQFPEYAGVGYCRVPE